jgi:glycosyltransferase involved in cell wall biosynthesis
MSTLKANRPTSIRSDRPLISAVIPVYNGEEFVADAIRSVLAQTYSPVECILVDDGSTDGTAAVVRTFGAAVRYIRCRNEGVAAARNRGAAAARGELLAFLDVDDVWLADKLLRQMDLLQQQPYNAAVLCPLRVVNRDLRPLAVRQLGSLTDLLRRLLLLDGITMNGISQAALIRRTCFEAVGGFDPRLGTSADWDFLVRFLLRYSLGWVDEPLVLYRLHGNNMSHNVRAMEHDMLLALEKFFASKELCPELRALRHRAYANLHRLLAGSYFVNHELRPFLHHACASLLHHPRVLPYFLAFPLRRLHTRGATNRITQVDLSSVMRKRARSQIPAHLSRRIEYKNVNPLDLGEKEQNP